MEEDKDIHTCKLCSYRCYSSHVMYKHIDLHKRRPKTDIFTCDSKTPEMFDCTFCEFNTNLQVDLIEHVRVFHEGEEANEELENIFKCYRCEDCDFETHSVIVLTKHVDDCNTVFRNSHNKEGGKTKNNIKQTYLEDLNCFKCAQCPFKTRIKKNLRSHNQRKHPKVIDWLQCDQCNYITKVRRNLTVHVKRRHTNPEEKHWIDCTHCTYKTIHNSDFKRHIRNKHTDPAKITWFKCTQCDYKTKHSYSLKLHVTAKHVKPSVEKKWLRCAQCEFKCLGKQTLKGHINIRHTYPEDVEWFECDYCPYETHLQNYLRKHILLCHRKKVK